MTTKLPPLISAWLQAMLASSVIWLAPVFAAETATEHTLRAALLFNFLKFTTWPATATESPQLLICTASSDPDLVSAMEQLNARQIRNKPLHTVRYQQQSDCNVIYVDSRQRWSNITGKRNALTVGGYRGFAADGGMIEIDLRETGARFDINLGEARHAGINFYPQLLQLARRVIE